MDGSEIEGLLRDAERAEAALGEREHEAAAMPPGDGGGDQPVPGILRTPEAQRRYVLGGFGRFTLVSRATGARYTYRVSTPASEKGKPRECRKCQGTGLWGQYRRGKCFACQGTGETAGRTESGPSILFVALLTGPDNKSDYTYLGNLRTTPHPRYEHGRKSRIGADAPGARAVAWFLSRLFAGAPTDACEFWHEGRCGRCGLPLTDPESIERGIGPVCAERG